MKVLIVEDDRALGLFLQKGLQMEGYETAWVGDGQSALDYVGLHKPDLMILDLSLPLLDGTAVLEKLRASSSQMAVLVLTGRNHVDEKVRCLDAGADDFLLKPFSFHELSARCRAILRRQTGSASTLLQSGTLQMDLLHRKVEHCGKPIELTPKEFSLLECLLQTKGTCCTREALLRDVWQIHTNASTNVVDVYVNYLRKKLAASRTTDRGEATSIETVRGAGYRIVVTGQEGYRANPAPSSTLLACGA